ncbi:MAG: ammonia-forming cytochrome c nitrite reductase subunit c552 [bacterium]|nr:ammonia-forming cytochrome c nitrite reductase subunit c552 [bacterium]
MFVISLVGVVVIASLLTDIFEKKQESRYSYIKTQEIAKGEPDPDQWKANFPREYAAYMKTLKTSELAKVSPYARYGGSESISKLEKDPRMKRLFAGYPFGIDYNEERGHMNAVQDMLNIKRLGDKKPGSCMTCKSPQVPLFIEQHGAEKFYNTPVTELVDKHGFKHSISCADCHDSETMELTIRRPAYIEAQTRRGIDIKAQDQNLKRTDACAQCHVEYYWLKETKYVTFPWDKGLSVDSIEAYYDSIGFSDWVHAETGAKMVKMQHPEYEMWSSGIHSRSGVGCADCHMPYTRDGSIKVTDHWIRSPYMNLTNACLTCHRESEDEMASRIREIQDRTWNLMDRSEVAIIAAIDAIKAAIEAGATDEELADCRNLHRKAHLRWDFVSAENSMGFHSPQEATRMLGDAIDFARQAELSATKLLAQHGKLEVAALTK